MLLYLSIKWRLVSVWSNTPEYCSIYSSQSLVCRHFCLPVLSYFSVPSVTTYMSSDCAKAKRAVNFIFLVNISQEFENDCLYTCFEKELMCRPLKLVWSSIKVGLIRLLWAGRNFRMFFSLVLTRSFTRRMLMIVPFRLPEVRHQQWPVNCSYSLPNKFDNYFSCGPGLALQQISSNV